MTKRTTAVGFFVLAGLLYSTRYVAAAIFGSGVTSWNSELFHAMLQYVGRGPTTWAAVAAALGIIYLVWAEYEEWTTRRNRAKEEPPRDRQISP